MDQPFDARLEFDERSEIGDARNLAGHASAGFQLRDGLRPGVGRKLLQSQRDLMRVAIDLENLDVDHVTGRDHVGGFHAARVRHVGNVQQTIDSAQIDESAELHEAANCAAHHHAFFDALEGFLLGLLFALFQNHAPVDHDIFRRGVELGDPAFDFLPDHLFKIGLFARAAARGRHERAHADVDAEPALHHFKDRSGNNALVGKCGFKAGPIARRLDLDGRKLVHAFLIAAANGDQQPVARLQLPGRFGRKHAVHLAADVDEHAVGRDGNHRAFNGLAAGVVGLFELRKNIAERGVGNRGLGWVGKVGSGHSGKTACLSLWHNTSHLSGIWVMRRSIGFLPSLTLRVPHRKRNPDREGGEKSICIYLTGIVTEPNVRRF